MKKEEKANKENYYRIINNLYLSGRLKYDEIKWIIKILEHK